MISHINFYRYISGAKQTREPLFLSIGSLHAQPSLDRAGRTRDLKGITLSLLSTSSSHCTPACDPSMHNTVHTMHARSRLNVFNAQCVYSLLLHLVLYLLLMKSSAASAAMSEFRVHVGGLCAPSGAPGRRADWSSSGSALDRQTVELESALFPGQFVSVQPSGSIADARWTLPPPSRFFVPYIRVRLFRSIRTPVRGVLTVYRSYMLS